MPLLQSMRMPSCEQKLLTGALQGKRVFFSADARLPKDTPEPIAQLRKLELLSIQVKVSDLQNNEDSFVQMLGC